MSQVEVNGAWDEATRLAKRDFELNGGRWIDHFSKHWASLSPHRNAKPINGDQVYPVYGRLVQERAHREKGNPYVEEGPYN